MADPRGNRTDTGRAAGGRNGPRRPRFKKPALQVFPTTLWEYPSQHYNAQIGELQGDPEYKGATPSWVIWQLLQRYTRENDLVVDPMAGSGTTIDVCRDLGRKVVAYDLAPTRGEIIRADARELPLEDGVADFAFVDPPYSTHIDYSDDPRCIGRLDAGEGPSQEGEMMGQAYYEAMEEVIAELHRVLKNRRYMGLYVSDSWRKRRGDEGGGGKGGKRGKGSGRTASQHATKGGVFMPIGFELFSIMRDYFTPVDIICVVRQNAKLAKGNWRKTAVEQNYFLRGFNYLFIMKKVEE